MSFRKGFCETERMMPSGWGSNDVIKGTVDSDGNFDLTLTVVRYFWFVPKLIIYTDCNDAFVSLAVDMR